MKKIFVILALFLGVVAACSAQDVIKTKAREYRGRIKSADNKSVTIEIPGQGTIAVNRSIIQDLKIQTPQIVVRGIAAYKKGDYKQAQVDLASVMTQFPGLDTAWAAEGIDYYGRSCLLAGDLDNAAKAFTIFLESYDAATHPLARDAEIGMAEIDLARGNFEKALPKFQELTAEFDKQVKPPNEQFQDAAASFLGLAECLEAQNDPAGAQDAYLKVVALYPADHTMPETLYRLAALYERQAKPAETLVYLNDLAVKFPSSPYAQKAAELKKKVESQLAEKKAETPVAAEK